MVKIKDAEKLCLTYTHNCSNIQIGVDDSDHIVFICNKCSNPLEVIEVYTSNGVLIRANKIDNCTYIYLVCHNCKSMGKRKFYWSEELGTYCWQRTDNKKVF